MDGAEVFSDILEHDVIIVIWYAGVMLWVEAWL